jgi:hypothetical protein
MSVGGAFAIALALALLAAMAAATLLFFGGADAGAAEVPLASSFGHTFCSCF